MNLANKLTMLRIFLIPVFLIFLTVKDISPWGMLAATFVFIIASLTDKLDGYIARSRNQITRFGKLMDPLADKLLVTAALISLVEFHIIPTWVAMLIIAREYAVTGLRLIAAGDGIVIAASAWGKAKTATQIAAIIFALLKLIWDNNGFRFLSELHISIRIFDYLTYISMFAAVIITIISGVDYFVKNREVFKNDK